MKRTYRHILLPAVVPGLFAVVASMPVEVMGCRNRGLAAVCIALVGALAGLGAAGAGLRQRVRNAPGSGWWMLSALILAVPAVVMVFMA